MEGGPLSFPAGNGRTVVEERHVRRPDGLPGGGSRSGCCGSRHPDAEASERARRVAQPWAAEGEGQHGGRAGRADRGRGDGERPAGRHLVVDEQDGRPGGHVGVEPTATAYGGDALRGVGLAGARRDGRRRRIAQVPTTGTCMTRDRPSARSRTSVGRVADSTTTITSGREVHSGDQSFITSITACARPGGTGPSGALEQLPQPVAPADVGQPAQRPCPARRPRSSGT